MNMKYIYYKSEKGNFGDDLNEWLWPKLFGSFQKSDLNFIGIGSILFPENKQIGAIKGENKIVFGTGVRPTPNYSVLELDNTWNISFLRGPLSAYMLDNKHEYITDAAYAVRQVENFDSLLNTEKKYEVSLMPYFKSLEYFDWPAICKELGYHYISPLSENGVEFTMREIAASKRIITEAMHGAIVADLLRVPWHRFVFSTPHTEGSKISDFKWTDWTLSMKMANPPVTFIPFYLDTRLNQHCLNLTGKRISPQFFLKGRIRKEVLKNLNNIDEYSLSKSEILADIDRRIADKIEALKAEINCKTFAHHS